MSPPANPGKTGHWLPVLAMGAALACTVFLVHFPALNAKALLFDDEQYLTKNILVQQPGWASARRFLAEIFKPSTVGGYYQPLTMISLMLDYPLASGPTDVRPFHRTSLIFHALNTVLLFLLLRWLFSGPAQDGRRPGPAILWPAAFVALLFGIHPLTVEPIPWVGERKTLLATLFALISLIWYVRWVRSTRWTAMAGSLVAFVLALLSKPTVTPLPLLLVLLDIWPLRRFSRRSLFEKIPFLVIAALSAVITFVSQARSAAVHLPQDYGPGRIPLVLAHNIVFYLYKIVWPHDLSTHYPYPDPLTLSHPMILAGAIGTVLLMVILAVSLRWTRAAAISWLFFFIAILPTMQIVGFSNVIASDKYAYFPSLGICLFVAWLLSRMWSISDRSTRLRRIAITLVVLLIAAAEARATRGYLEKWRTTESFYRHMISLAPQAAPLYNDLAADAARRGLHDTAALRFRQAIHLDPENGWFRSNYGAVLFEQGKLNEAAAEYREALRLNPELADAANNLGLVLARQGNLDEAETFFRQSLSKKNEVPDTHNNLAALLLLKGKNEEAAASAAEAVRLNPHHAEAQFNLGLARARQGQLDEALSRFDEAVRLRPDYIDALIGRADVFTMRQDWDRAEEAYRAVLRLRPDHESARRGRDRALARRAATTQSSQ
ncbi:MAG TPA: tetratricopeptide repeat protein [Phycisphaerae bacterium]|nr:tetratricopeptide repeat protein [Phycisphaerae bacterium]